MFIISILVRGYKIQNEHNLEIKQIKKYWQFFYE